MNMFISKLSRQTYFAAVFGLAFGATVVAKTKVVATEAMKKAESVLLTGFGKYGTNVRVTRDGYAIEDAATKRDMFAAWIALNVIAYGYDKDGNEIEGAKVKVEKKDAHAKAVKAAKKAVKKAAKKNKASKAVVKADVDAVVKATDDAQLAKLVAKARALMVA
jgi:hypothetical protein